MIKDVMPAAVANAQKALKTKVEDVDSADYVDAEAIDNARADQDYYEAIETSGNVAILKAYTENFITKAKKYSLVKTVKTSKTSNTSATYKKTKLTKGKNYYYAVKTYKVIDGKTFYGKMSKKVSVKVK